jgi:hypothetical protein
MTISGTEPMTLQLVAQCLNQVHHHVPLIRILLKEKLHTFQGLLPCITADQNVNVVTVIPTSPQVHRFTMLFTAVEK